jgi:phosphoserine phosphatase
MQQYYGRVPGRSGEYCLDHGACTAEQLNKALAEQATERDDFGEAAKYTASTIEDTHRSVLEHLDAARRQVAELIAGHKTK